LFDNSLLDVVENGVLILDRNLSVHFWNNWLTANTSILKKDIEGANLVSFFDEKLFKSLKRKIKISLSLNRSTFIDAKVNKYLIPIKREKITHSIFTFMQQDITIKPFRDNLVVVLIYDVTPLLEAEYVISKQLEQFRTLATTDNLTQIYNRQKFNTVIEEEIKRASRYKRSLSLILFDIDHFKSVNDIYGHLVGDDILKAMVDVVSSHIRISDIFARWGGEEFTILIPETDINGAKILAEKLRSKIAETVFDVVGHKTCSFGVTTYNGQTKEEFINEADTALYFIKENGRDNVGYFNGKECLMAEPL